MVTRLVNALFAGVITAVVVLIVLILVDTIFPGTSVDASFWAGIIGLLSGLYVFFIGDARL